jgi:hypothetical protein
VIIAMLAIRDLNIEIPHAAAHRLFRLATRDFDFDSEAGDQEGGARGFARDVGWIERGRTTLSIVVRSGAGARGAIAGATDPSS